MNSDQEDLFRSKVNISIECLRLMHRHLVTQQLEFSKIYDHSFDHKIDFCRAKDQKDALKYILTFKNKLSRPQVKYQVHFVFYIIFLCLLSYLALFVKPSLLQINEEMGFLIDNGTCSGDERFCPMAKPAGDSCSILQMIINIWVFMFALEEFRQVSQRLEEKFILKFFYF